LCCALGGGDTFFGFILETDVFCKDFRGLGFKGEQEDLLVLTFGFEQGIQATDLVSNRITGHYTNI
jgi:hypothetical protein